MGRGEATKSGLGVLTGVATGGRLDVDEEPGFWEMMEGSVFVSTTTSLIFCGFSGLGGLALFADPGRSFYLISLL